ncbi:MAG TPA: hypothetical protein VIE88_19300, partial [Vicinamibacteria bacterium]
HHLTDGFVADACELPQELSMVEEVRPEHLGQSKNPLGVSDVGEDLFLEQFGEDGCSLGAAGGAETSAFAGESDEELEAALGTNDAGETGFEESTIHVREDSGIPEGAPEAASLLESLFPQALEGLEMGIEELIEGAGSWVAGPINGRAELGPGKRAEGRSGAAHAGAGRNPSSGTSLGARARRAWDPGGLRKARADAAFAIA